MIKTIEETGTIFGRKLLKTKIQKKRRASGGMSGSRSDPAVLALGRVIGSLCILTTRKGEGDDALSGAMVASWISQASFSPPGITIAVAKDRAVEELLHRDDKFIVNILSDNRHHKLMRQFLQPFPPGANRFEGISIIENVAQGGPVLSDALAYLDCLVKQRLETTDHWIIYAVVEHGNISNSEAKTAVHHRKVGTSY